VPPELENHGATRQYKSKELESLANELSHDAETFFQQLLSFHLIK
jgi:hypothetical protein